jgi:hypothetical protein
LKRCKSPGSDEIPAELIQVGGEILCSRIHKLINFIWNQERLPISERTLSLYKFTRRVIKLTSNCRGISLLSTSYKISNILLSRLSPYIDESIGGLQCEFQRNKSTTDQLFCVRLVLEKKWEYNGTVHELFVDFKKAYDSVRR